ncbi:MAG: dihydropteroate synthase [Anaerolineales bacterium]|nr:dihydropteroate synthase [Anaerolineales bacterium]
MDTIISGSKSELVIGPGRPTVIIGNRIRIEKNPRLAKAAIELDMQPFVVEAQAQITEGADVIQIDLEGQAIDEARVLPEVVKAVSKAVPNPICIKTQNPQALAAAIDLCSGKPLVYAITAEIKSMKEILPVAFQKEVAVITVGDNETGLPYEYKGLPIDFDEDLELARLVFRKALSVGIPRQDIILGVRSKSLADDPKAAITTLALIEYLARIEQINFIFDTGDLVHGLDESEKVSQVLITLAISKGVTCVIADPVVVKSTVGTVDLALNKRQSCH